MHVAFRDLPSVVQDILRTAGYRQADISVRTSETYSVSSSGQDGYKAFCIAVNLETGERLRWDGSWGGANAFNPHNAVDLDDSVKTLPVNGCVIKGMVGTKVFASIIVHPSNVNFRLLKATEELTVDEKRVLVCFARYKPAYRREYMPKNAETLIDGLVARGYLKRNRAGATQITTHGKNACGD